MNNDSKIHLIMISVDRGVAIAGSAVQKRMEHFGTLVESIDVITVGAESAMAIKLRNNVTVHGVTGSFKLDAAWKAIFLAKKLARQNTVIVTQDPFEVGLIGVFASWLSRRPLHAQVHIDFFSPYFRQESLRQRFQCLLAPFVLARAKSIRVVSQKIATYLRDAFAIDASRIIIAPIFVDVAAVKNTPTTVDLHATYPQFDWIVLVAARYVQQKNIPLAIEAFKVFLKKHPKAGLVIAGSGPEEADLKSTVADLHLSDSVVVGSWTTEFVSCMRTADAFLMTSDYEGWGMTVIEASAVAKPIIMTNVGCAGEFLEHEKSGLVVERRDMTAVVAALERLYTNRAFATNLGQEAKRRADTYMTHEENDALMLQSWKSAL